MGRYLIAMTSITYAMKAKALLNEKGLYCEIQRTPKDIGSGCGYSLRVQNDPNTIIAFLESSSVTFKNSVVKPKKLINNVMPQAATKHCIKSIKAPNTVSFFIWIVVSVFQISLFKYSTSFKFSFELSNRELKEQAEPE